MFSGEITILIFSVVLVISVFFIKKYENEISHRYTRKVFHVINGTMLSISPFICRKEDYMAIILVGFLFILLLGIFRIRSKKKMGLCSMLYTTSGFESYGELLFPIAVIILTVYTKLDPFYYVIPILIITFSDTCSAIVGREYGKVYLNRGEETRKTLLGFFAFMGSCFVILMAGFWHYNGEISSDSVIASILFSFSLAVLEATSISGTDNINVPLTAYLYLLIYMKERNLNSVILIIIFGTIILVILAVLLHRKVTPLTVALLGNSCLISFLYSGVNYMLFVLCLELSVFMVLFVLQKRKSMVQLFDFEKFQIFVPLSLMAISAGMKVINAEAVLAVLTWTFLWNRKMLKSKEEFYEK